MKVVLFTGGAAEETAAALTAEGLSPDVRPLPAPTSPEASGALVAGLRGASDALTSEEPDAVLVAGSGDAALAVALTAVKLQIPTGWVRYASSPADTLIARVADQTIDATAPAGDLALQVKALGARRIPAP